MSSDKETVCGIDQSYTSTGVVIFENSSYKKHYVITTQIDRDDPLTYINRAKHIATEVVAIMHHDKVDRVVIEGLGFGAKGDQTRNLAGLQYLILSRLIDMDIPVSIIAPTSLKKQATGKGNAGKDEMIEAVGPELLPALMKIPKSKGRGDIADAYGLAKHF